MLIWRWVSSVDASCHLFQIDESAFRGKISSCSKKTTQPLQATGGYCTELCMSSRPFLCNFSTCGTSTHTHTCSVPNSVVPNTSAWHLRTLSPTSSHLTPFILFIYSLSQSVLTLWGRHPPPLSLLTPSNLNNSPQPLSQAPRASADQTQTLPTHLSVDEFLLLPFQLWLHLGQVVAVALQLRQWRTITRFTVCFTSHSPGLGDGWETEAHSQRISQTHTWPFYANKCSNPDDFTLLLAPTPNHVNGENDVSFKQEYCFFLFLLDSVLQFLPRSWFPQAVPGLQR